MLQHRDLFPFLFPFLVLPLVGLVGALILRRVSLSLSRSAMRSDAFAFPSSASRRSHRTVSLRNRSRCLRFTEKRVHRDGGALHLMITHPRSPQSSSRALHPLLDWTSVTKANRLPLIGSARIDRESNRAEWGSLRFLLAARIPSVRAGEEGSAPRLRNRPRIAERRAHARRLISRSLRHAASVKPSSQRFRSSFARRPPPAAVAIGRFAGEFAIVVSNTIATRYAAE